MLAAYYGHADLVALLIKYGADPNRLNDKRQSPVAGAVFKRLDNVVEVKFHVPTTNDRHKCQKKKKKSLISFFFNSILTHTNNPNRSF